MRLNEIIPSEQLDENWKKWALAGAAAAGVALGANQLSKTHHPAPTTVQEPLNLEKPSKAITSPGAFKQPEVKVEPLPPLKTIPDPISESPYEQILTELAVDAGIIGTELAAFIAQCAHETLNFMRLKEFGNYIHFKKYDPKYSPQKAKILGNKYYGDGQKYKGRGFIQLTGRYNYRKAGEALGLPLEKHPELAEKPEIAARIAIWYWQTKVQPRVDDWEDVTQVTKTINPRLNGLQDREEKFQTLKASLETNE